MKYERYVVPAELEAAIREDPTDDARWSVLEDWLLEQGDERTEWMQAIKDGKTEHADWMRQVVTTQMLHIDSNKRDPLWLASAGCTWRATYIDGIHFDAPASTRTKLLARLLGYPTAALARTLRISADVPAHLADIFGLLATAACHATLRAVWFSAHWKPAAQQVTLDGNLLAPFALDELRFSDRAIRVTYAPALARLQRLQLVPGSADDLREVFERGGMPALRSLTLSVDTLAHRGWTEFAGLEGIFDGTAAPALEMIDLDARSPELRAEFLERLANSPLAAKLRSLQFRFCEVSRDDLPERHLAALGHLCV